MTPTILKTNNTITKTAPANCSDFQLDELNTIVGGPIEMIFLNDGTAMVLHEKGKLEELPLNQLATLIARKQRCLLSGDWIAGDVLYCDADMIK